MGASLRRALARGPTAGSPSPAHDLHGQHQENGAFPGQGLVSWVFWGCAEGAPSLGPGAPRRRSLWTPARFLSAGECLPGRCSPVPAVGLQEGAQRRAPISRGSLPFCWFFSNSFIQQRC